MTPPLPPGLYLVATPIGNLGDMSARAIQTLNGVTRIYCEDRRISGRLCQHFGIKTPLANYHEHNAEKARPAILEALAAGEAIGLISDAGLPLISDPGFKLVRDVRAAGFTVTSVPGPSSALTALQLSGLPTDRFVFLGFLPVKSGARRSLIERFGRLGISVIFHESAKRLAACLDDIAATLGEDQQIAVTRELTKKFEEVLAGSVAEVTADLTARDGVKGEVTVVLAGAEPAETSAEDIDDLLRAALTRLPVKQAAAEIAGQTGQSKRDLYQRALALKDTSHKDDD